MKRLTKMGIILLTAAVVMFAVHNRLRASEERSSVIHGAPQIHTNVRTNTNVVTNNVTATNHVLYNNYINTGLSATPETAADFQTIDASTTIYCPSSNGCTLEVTQNVQVDTATSVGNWWGTLYYVDGSPIETGPYLGETNVDGSPVTATSIQTTTISHGDHTVQSAVFSYFGLTTELYTIKYSVYVP